MCTSMRSGRHLCRRYEGRPHFQALLSPDNEEVARVTASLAKAITDFLRRRGLGPESDREESDPLSRDQPWLAGLYAASVSGRTAFGPNAGRRTTRTGDQIDPESMDAFASPRCANVNGFSLHANIALNGADPQTFGTFDPLLCAPACRCRTARRASGRTRALPPETSLAQWRHGRRFSSPGTRILLRPAS